MNREFAKTYGAPVAEPDAPRPELRWSARGAGRAGALLGTARRRIRGRRLAYVDSHFPWAASGFRYADALALRELRPDTVFFSLHRMTDDFPAPVLPLADFPRLAPRLGITDVYGVFLDFMAGLHGIPRPGGAAPTVTDGLDLSGVLRRHQIRSHALLYPGGGFAFDEPSLARAGALVDAADQVMSFVSVALERYPSITPIAPAVVDTHFYREQPFAQRPSATLLFAADATPRKGLDVALAAQAAVHRTHGTTLTVAGPHADRTAPDPPGTTFVGRQTREELRDLHQRCRLFLSPVRREQADEGDRGVIDGFPTTAAAEAMASGCLLITANPLGDHRYLRPGIDYLEREPTPEAFAEAIIWATDHPAEAATIAATGAQRIRERLDCRRGAAERLALMGFPVPELRKAPDGGVAR